jgi:creatinine amidohydrolase
MNRPVRLHELTPEAARERLRAAGRVLIPVGTLSFRGSHLPLGADTILLDRLADDLSARTGAPRAPVIPVGVHLRRDATVPGVAALTRKTLHRVMNELIASWEEGGGVRETLILTAHAAEPHLEALSTIRAIGTVRVVDILGFDFSTMLDHPNSAVHGGELDTSLLLFAAPDLVDDAEAITRLSATREKGARIYDYILEQVESRWPLSAPVNTV